MAKTETKTNSTGQQKKKRGKCKTHKISLKTSSEDYQGNLGLPEKVTQREFETTGQFFRRLDRLVAKAKVEASLESRFDINLSSHNSKDNERTGGARKKNRSAKQLQIENEQMLRSSRKYRDKRRKRYGRG